MRGNLNTLQTLARATSSHVRARKWNYVFGGFVWLYTWYVCMVILTYLIWASPFPDDYMPVIAGVPILLLGWQAVAFRRKLDQTIDGFDDGAALIFPSAQTAAKQAFLDDMRRTVARLSYMGSIAMGGLGFVFAIAGIVELGAPETEVDWFTRALLLVGLPITAAPVGVLFGQLVGYGQLPRIMDRHQIGLAGLSTPPARAALRGLDGIYSFAITTCSVMSLWFAAWWIWWGLGQDWKNYDQIWGVPFQILWLVSLGLFAFAGAIPAWDFRRRIARLKGGPEGERALVEMIDQAVQDLRRLSANQSANTLVELRRVAELQEFINNSRDRNVVSWLLHPAVHTTIILTNLLVRFIPWSPLPQLYDGSPIFGG